MKFFLSLFLFISIFGLVPTNALALTIDNIGNSAPTNLTFTQWYYTSQNPIISGTTTANGTVTITIDSIAATTVADASGNWSYTPTTLTTGDHTVIIADTTEQASFTMTIGSAGPTGSSSASGSATLPVAGTLSTTLMILGMGGLLVFGGLKLSQRI